MESHHAVSDHDIGNNPTSYLDADYFKYYLQEFETRTFARQTKARDLFKTLSKRTEDKIRESKPVPTEIGNALTGTIAKRFTRGVEDDEPTMDFISAIFVAAWSCTASVSPSRDNIWRPLVIEWQTECNTALNRAQFTEESKGFSKSTSSQCSTPAKEEFIEVASIQHQIDAIVRKASNGSRPKRRQEPSWLGNLIPTLTPDKENATTS